MTVYQPYQRGRFALQINTRAFAFGFTFEFESRLFVLLGPICLCWKFK